MTDLNGSNKLKMVEIAKEGLLKFGSLSISYLMRKLKVTESMAKEIMNEATSDNARNVIKNGAIQNVPLRKT